MYNSASHLQIEPCIAEFLRTNTYPPSIRLQVEHVVQNLASKHQSSQTDEQDIVSHRNASRLYLTDGVLSIQAVLNQHRTSDLPRVGNVLELNRYEVRRTKRLRGDGKIIYIGIQDYTVISENKLEGGSDGEGGFIREDTASQMSTPQKRKRGRDDSDDETERINDTVDRGPSQARTPILKKLRFQTPTSERDGSEHPTTPQSSQESEDGFETVATDPSTIFQRREILRSIEHVPETRTQFSPKASVTRNPKSEDTILQIIPKSSLNETSQRTQSQLPNIRDAPRHTLHSLLHPKTPLPKRSYACSVFAVISWISTSLIQRSPFPPKRHIKLHDPSIQARHAGITLAIFVNAKDFCPSPGTAALFRGVVMQRWENDVILNAYPNLKEVEDDWCVTEKNELVKLGCDVVGMEKWWSERKGKKSTDGEDHGHKGVEIPKNETRETVT